MYNRNGNQANRKDFPFLFFDMEEMKSSRKIKPFNLYHNEQSILGKDTHKGIQDCERILKLKLCKSSFFNYLSFIGVKLIVCGIKERGLLYLLNIDD